MGPIRDEWSKWQKWSHRIFGDLQLTIEDNLLLNRFYEEVRPHTDHIDRLEGGPLFDFIYRAHGHPDGFCAPRVAYRRRRFPTPPSAPLSAERNALGGRDGQDQTTGTIPISLT